MKYLAGALKVVSTYNYSHVALVAYEGSDSKLFEMHYLFDSFGGSESHKYISLLQSGFNYGRKMLYGTGPQTNVGHE